MHINKNLVKLFDVPDTAIIAEPKAGRNDPCPCKSGKKYKQCHGK